MRNRICTLALVGALCPLWPASAPAAPLPLQDRGAVDGDKKEAAPALDAAYLAERDALRTEVLEKYAVLAEWCQGEKQRYLLQARYLYNEILKQDPAHEVKSKADALRNMPPREFRTRNRTSKKGLKEYATKKAMIDAPTGKKFASLAKKMAFIHAYHYAPANKTTRSYLKKNDFALVYNYGLISKEDKKAAAKILTEVEGTFLDEKNKQYKRQLKFWPDAWGFSTKHYLLMSNAPHELVFRFAEECENLYQGLRIWFGEDMPLRDNYKSEKLVVWLFGDEDSYEIVLQGLGIQKNPSPGAAGFFGAGQRAYFFWADRFYGNRPFEESFRKLAETFYHEGTHQALALQHKFQCKGVVGKYQAAWLVEAIANYCETMEVIVQPDGTKKFQWGFPHPYEGYRAANSHLQGAYHTAHGQGKFRFTPLKTFTIGTYGGFQSQGAYHYNQALGLAHFLVHGEGGKYKDAFRKQVKENYALGKTEKTLWEECELEEAELTEKYIAWIKKMKFEGRGWDPGKKLPPGAQPVPGGQGGGPPPGGWPGGTPPGGK
ncbi:MAG: hypothetical protein ACYTGX_04415 [Planctomycetota bacterium]|jgi:hypothetical protein